VDWPFSTEAYRAALLMSFGFLTVSVRDDSGDEVEKNTLSTWSTPPRVTAEYGDTLKVRADGSVRT
jgi:hypothetical protein